MGASELALQQIVSVYLLSFAVMTWCRPFVGRAGAQAGDHRRHDRLHRRVGGVHAPNLGVLLAFRRAGPERGAGAIISRAMVRDVYSDAARNGR